MSRRNEELQAYVLTHVRSIVCWQKQVGGLTVRRRFVRCFSLFGRDVSSSTKTLMRRKQIRCKHELSIIPGRNLVLTPEGEHFLMEDVYATFYGGSG